MRFGLAQVGREFRSGEVRVLAAALALAVAAMTAVGFFTDRVAQGVQARSAEVLAADLVLRSNRPIPEARDSLAAELGLEHARTASFPSVVLAGDESALADIEGVATGYPLRGSLRVSERFDAESETVNAVPPRGEAWADPRLMARLGAEVGTTVRLGQLELVVSRLLDYRPDQGFSFAELAPTLLINYEDVAASGLVAPGSRVSYRLLLAGDAGALAAYRNRVELGLGERLRGIEDAQPEIGNAVERAGRFIGLASLVSALIAGVAVAMAARRFASRRMDTVALMKCVGAPRRFVLAAMMVQLLVVGLAASAAGLALGWVAQEGLVRILADLVGADLPPPTLAPAIGGLVLAGIVLAGFALVPIIELCRTPPGRVLRRDLLPPAAGPLLLYGAAVGGALALLAWQVRDLALVGWLALGTGGVVLGLAAGGWLLVQAAARLRGGGAAWRYGLANVARRGRDSMVQVGAFGIGLMVLLLLTLVRTGLLDQWRATLPEDAPNRFLINIQPHEAEGVAEFLASRFGGGELVPLIRARLTAINGRTVAEIEFSSPRAQGFIDRESNLSTAAQPAADNRVVAGRWWPVGDEAEVSLETDYARDLGIALEQARMQREANPTPENWRREAQVLEEMGQYESAARAYEGELAALPEGDEAAARRKEARADLERVQQAARGTADGDPPSQHREQLDERWEPKPAPKQAVPRPEPRPAPPSDERIVRKWYFWVTIAAIAASAAAVTGIAVKASRDRRRDALDLTRDPGTMPPPLFRF